NFFTTSSSMNGGNMGGDEKASSRLTCPACGYLTITADHDICPICRWQFDPWQVSHPDDANGPNYVTLRQAQKNFESFGAADPREIQSAKKTLANYKRD